MHGWRSRDTNRRLNSGVIDPPSAVIIGFRLRRGTTTLNCIHVCGNYAITMRCIIMRESVFRLRPFA